MDKLKMIEAILCGCGEQEGERVGLPFVIGEKIFVRTVTHHLTGRVKSVCGKFITLSDAAWIADDGRFSQAINEGKLGEVEPVNCDVRLNAETIIDVYSWAHDLPRVQK